MADDKDLEDIIEQIDAINQEMADEGSEKLPGVKQPVLENSEEPEASNEEVSEPVVEASAESDVSDANEPAEPETLQDFYKKADDASMEEVMNELPDESFSEDESVSESELASVTHFPRRESGSESGVMSLQLRGDIQLELQYQYEGENVSVRFENGFLCLELTDGTEFKVPVSRLARKKAA